MDTLVKALAPVFAAGFAVQQLLEILDPGITAIVKIPTAKKIVASLISLALGLLLAYYGGFRVLTTLGASNPNAALDVTVTGLILSAGTEGSNSIMKFLGYAKENKKAEAANNTDSAPLSAMRTLNRGQQTARTAAAGGRP